MLGNLLRFKFVSPLFALILYFPGVAVGANLAGKVMFANGEVKVVDASGAGRFLIKGDKVFAGDTISTGEGRAQIQFTDGGMASIKPNTEYRLAEYIYLGQADGTERGFFDLIKGSVRFVTGVIGKKQRRNFRIKTATATIGIRGTSGQVESCVGGSCGDRQDGTYISTYAGIVTIASGAYSGEVKPQETFFCDGNSCFEVVERGSPETLSPIAPDLNDNYRQGEQLHHSDPSPPSMPSGGSY